jgi:Ras-related protein Rab-2A
MSQNESDLNTNKSDYSFKMIVIGDAGVGKSCLTGRAIKERFEGEYSPTVGFEFLTFTTIIENKIVKLQIWDTCGQEAYRSIITNFYRNASLAMMVYAINSKESFVHINQWLKEVKIQSHPDIKIILIGNKCDLNEEREVTYEEANNFKEENQVVYFEETSAKTGINAKEVFTECARLLYNERNKYKARANNSNCDSSANNISASKGRRSENNRNKGVCC